MFGEVPVTWPEVEAWVLAVAGIDRESWRWDWYVRNWNVIEKIQRAKIEGRLDRVLAGEVARTFFYIPSFDPRRPRRF